MGTRLCTLRPGQSFSLDGCNVTGTLVRVGEGSATVKLDRAPQIVTVTDRKTGATRSFVAAGGQRQQWSRNTIVTPE